MSSNRGYGSNGSGGNNHNGGQSTQRPKVVHTSDKTDDKRPSNDNDPRYYQRSGNHGSSKDTERSYDSRYYGNSRPR